MRNNPIKNAILKYAPENIVRFIIYIKSMRRTSRARKESNKWLKKHCAEIKGHVLSIGSGNDSDRQGGYYKNYFPLASSYTTSEVSADFDCDIILNVKSMPEIKDEQYDCIFCSGVLEHVDDFNAGMSEMTRVLKNGGILLLGLPFRQKIHMQPNDYWRFTKFGIFYLLNNSYKVISIVEIDKKKWKDFPSAYWVKAIKDKCS